MNPLKRKILPKYNKAKRKLAHIGNYLTPSILKRKKKEKGEDLDQKLVHSLSGSKIPGLSQLKHLKKVLSQRELWILRILLLVILVSGVWLGIDFYNKNLEKMPVVGGEYVEGVAGSPKYINPLYNSINDIDGDLSELVYSSLYTHNSKGELVSDLVQESSSNEDNTEYTFTIKDGVRWHTGGELTAKDIVFTFNAIKNPSYNSPMRSSFSGVSIEKVDERTVKFKLSDSYAPFKELLTFGILPEKQWVQIPASSANLAELNLKPIGSGPYEFKSLVKDERGSLQSYNLTRNKKYYGDKPYIKNISFDFFVNQTEAISALNRNEIDGISHLSSSAQKDLASQNSLKIHQLNFSKITSIFFNEDNNAALEDKKIKKSLAYSIDRGRIVNDVFNGNAQMVDSPLPNTSYAHSSEVTKYGYNISKAEELLKEAGWEKKEIPQETIEELEEKKERIESQQEKEKQEEDQEEDQEEESGNQEEEKQEELTLSEKKSLSLGEGNWWRKEKEDEEGYTYLNIKLSTVNRQKNGKVVEYIKEQWEDLGVKTIVNKVAPNEFRSQVLNPREFEALFHSQIVDNEMDAYSFWHSSQTGRSGLNISEYENEKVDELLEQTRTMEEKQARKEKYKQFQAVLTEDVPAIFMYSPYYLYVQSNKVKGFNVENIDKPRNRFSNISEWYIETGKKLVW